VGSDEVIDMLYRVLCVPGKDRVMTLPPTYGMYKVTANVNDVGVLEVPLITEGGAFQMDEQAVRLLLLWSWHLLRWHGTSETYLRRRDAV
jgi:histidinol-phosphate aminotransferase